MEVIIKMPKMTPTMQTGFLASWSKSEGDRVDKDDILFEVETDKVVSEVESTVSGVLKTLLIEEGTDVAPDTPIAIIECEAP